MKNYRQMQRAFWIQVRRELLKGLEQCSDEQRLVFKRMYAKGNLELPLTEVVNTMDNDKLGWAMQQVQATLD